MISEEHSKALTQFPARLRQLVQAELAAGNRILKIRSGSPAPPEGICLELAKPLQSRPRESDHQVRFFIRESNPCSGEISDSSRVFFLLEPPLEPGAYPDMDAIRRALEAEQRIANSEMDRSCRS